MTATPTNHECPRCQISTGAVTCPNCGLRLATQASSQTSSHTSSHTSWQDTLHSGQTGEHSAHFGYSEQSDPSSNRLSAQFDPDSAWSVRERNYFELYFHRLKKILTEPTASFHALPINHKTSSALAYALITNWIASIFSFIWNSLFGAVFLQSLVSRLNFSSVREGEAIMGWFWGMGSILIDPFVTLVTIFFTSFMIFLGAKLIVSPEAQTEPRAVTFDATLRVICYGMTPMILTVIPGIGGFAAAIGVFVFTVIGIKEYYRTSNGRSVFVVLFPKLIFLLAVSAFVTLGIGMIAALVGSMVK